MPQLYKGKISSRQMLCSDTGKVVHFTFAAASAVAKQRGRRVYKCKECGLFHTSKKKGKK